jgi:murein DD-endopeptidase MepM/ murein hydrolase activator NlpD
VTQ